MPLEITPKELAYHNMSLNKNTLNVDMPLNKKHIKS